ncbi:hypothetical protein [Pantoea cypripedii]|uniref:Uncharacterized protein n=1 Tax=Pantoea cypripedii TaxID=55209 RepID=A0A1X1ET36_PANCY|nr:hypothetical protein [Pantoea cypripedii]MBP2197196.1 DNA-binding MarR family transcriptional regulator [Pantoea cypripedii]ORM93127.1 hypothetical protein HA50_07120 [Pantoea cypripedii]
MMNAETAITRILLDQPGKTASQITELSGYTRNTVSETLRKMSVMGDVWRDAESRYYTAEKTDASDKRYIEIAENAMKLQAKNFWHRAAREWLKAHDETYRPGLRQKAIICRAHCIEMANWIRPKPEPEYPEKRSKRQ